MTSTVQTADGKILMETFVNGPVALLRSIAFGLFFSAFLHYVPRKEERTQSSFYVILWEKKR